MYLSLQPLPLDSRFLYLVAYMMLSFKCLLDVSCTEAASWVFIYKLAYAEDNSILSIPLAKNLSYSFFFPFPAPPLSLFFFFSQKHWFYLYRQSPNHFSGSKSGRSSFFNGGAPKMLVCCYQTHRQVASRIW